MMFLATTIPYVLDLVNLATYPQILDGELAHLERGAIWDQVKNTLRDFLGLFKDWRALRAILNSSGFSALFKSTKDYLQPILETLAMALPVMILLDDVKRNSVVVGVVYFFIYLLTSYASRSADQFSQRFDGLARPLNLTFLLGAVFLFVAGLATWQNLAILSVLVFLGFYVLQNLRKPINVAFISDQISHKVMASGLSVEAQFTTILAALFAPLLGALADRYGVGTALTIFGVGALFMFILVRVRETSGSAAQTQGHS
jgi:hypothetical protein